MSGFRIHARVGWLAAAFACVATAFGEEPATAARPFRIVVVDEQTGRGVPLVELRTVNQILYVTDSNGVVAFDEPGLMGRRVFFSIKSHGYEYAKDGFGIVGSAVETKPGGEARLKIKRINIAERLYRVTGGGIYRDSLLTGVPAPIREPLLNGQVLGQDSVLSAVYRGKVHWFWGDTNRPAYPLGNFHTPGAVSDLPDLGGLDPSKGVDLTYYVDEKGFAKPTCQMPGDGPTWVTGLVVLTDAEGRERMFANYAKIKPPMTTYERGAVEWDPEKNEFVKRAVYSGPPETNPGETLSGHTFQHRDGDRDYIYYCNPLPFTRVPADPEKIIDEDALEVFTCLEPGTAPEDGKVDRDPDGRLRYGWKTKARRVDQRSQDVLIKDDKLKPEEALVQLRDATTGKRVTAHGGSVYWNDFRKRWVLLFVEIGGTSMLGEMWFSEADTPQGPWTFARKIATHDTYSFYNPKQHPMFDQDGGRVVYFEGTYTASFSGAKEQTPRYEYNQVMYRLDLTDPRLSLPEPIYQVDASVATGGLATGPSLADGPKGKTIAFYAPDRPGEAGVAVVEVPDGKGGKTLALAGEGANPAPEGSTPRFYLLPPESRLAETTPIYEYSREGTARREYSIDPDRAEAGWRRSPEPVGRVWKNPGPSQVW
ncbi:hypothetical protein [Planctomyces sp. SH-PL62]|uniref:hypothetical protein n=1 Tax=Planctomyces sp. SH-PL62 TaxID=1636152 RepID=UPI00078E0411|nr:hypothetical protein [Planctomyces sp. SH-PL62]AMV38582.1 hypothetical protein VT85_14185 [Planctomyces sp. SH-PL62]